MSIWAAPMIPTTCRPVNRFCMVAKASARPPLTHVANITRGSPTARGTSSSRESMAPVSKKITLLGALICLAAMAASMEMPVPQNTISPSRISRAAATAIISRWV